ncbi:MAG TPA: 4'-phosphopantetheinyl transferase superfamily protein [Mucilaginibacter sp.]|jgi:4'-phosphopantetheinyl transferase|nr:4'-phosphopantetheinyl transferase superfamily protein [Mucilaginibacter sp.]
MSSVNVRYQFLEAVTWRYAYLCDFTIGTHSDIWRINISDNLSYLDHFSTLLNSRETDRANRYLQARDKIRFIISRAALRIILAWYLKQQPSSLEFEMGDNKKPFLKNACLQYNISHSGDWIAIAVSGSAVGVDVEWCNPLFDYKDIISEYFSDDEVKYINADEARSRFFLLWTRKEALTKATSKGLDDDLKHIPALNGEHAVAVGLLKSSFNWQVSSFELFDGYLGAIALTEQVKNIRFWDFDSANK